MRTKRSYRRAATAAALGLLLSLLPGASVSQETVTPQGAVIVQPPETTEPGSDVRVMTWNILGRGRTCELNRRMEKVAEEVARHADLDVIALQEVYRDQASKLTEHLRERGYGRFFVHFVKTKDCGRPGKDFGIALLGRVSRLNFMLRDYPLPQAPDRNPDTGEACDRGERRRLAAFTVLGRRGRLVDVYTTHLTSCGGVEARKEQARRIMSIIRAEERFFEAIRPAKFRPILMGDMNTRPNQGAYNIITERFRDAGASDPRSTYHTLNPRLRIDYIFFGRSDFRLNFVGVTSNMRLFSIFEVANPGGLDEKEDAATLPMPDHLPVTAHLSYD